MSDDMQTLAIWFLFGWVCYLTASRPKGKR